LILKEKIIVSYFHLSYLVHEAFTVDFQNWHLCHWELPLNCAVIRNFQ